MLATVVPKLTALIAHHGLAIATGVLTGAALGGAGVATGVIPVGGGSQAGPTLALLACPGSGPEVTRITSGQPVLVTARSADGTWLRIYVGEPGIDSGWATADALKLRDTASSLPVADCGTPSSAAPTPGPITSPPPPSQIALPTATAGPSPTPSPRPTASPKPTATPRPTASPKPTATPQPTDTPFTDLTAPTLSDLKTTGDPLNGDPSLGTWSIYHPSATCTPHSATISVTATDPDDAVASVELFYTPYNASAELSAPMTKVSATSWEGVLQADDLWEYGQILYHVEAVDAHGNSSVLLYDQELYNLQTNSC
jgi:hypothetical protein